MPSPPITATRIGAVGSGVALVSEVGMVTARRLVVVGALAPVVPQVERRLDRLVAAGVLGLVAGGTPVGVHVVHGSAPVRRCCMDDFDEPPRGGAGAPWSWITRRWSQELGLRIAREESCADPPRSGSSYWLLLDDRTGAQRRTPRR